MLKRLSFLSLLGIIPAACAYPSISEISAPPQIALVDVKVDHGKAILNKTKQELLVTPISVKVALEFLIIVAIAVVMVLFSGLPKNGIVDWEPSVRNLVAILAVLKGRLVI